MIYIANKKMKETTILKKYPDALILDISSKGEQPWVKFSPFYPHGKIPIPPYTNVSPKYFSQTVEGIWQGLKVFEHDGIDQSKFEIENMVGIKRTVRKFGKPLGHQYGVESKEILDYPTARKEIYLRTYAWVLDHLLQNEIQLLKEKAENHNLVLLDYNTNEDIENYKKPLSHAGLVKKYLLKKYPELDMLTFMPPLETTAKREKQTKGKQKLDKNTKKDKIQQRLFD